MRAPAVPERYDVVQVVADSPIALTIAARDKVTGKDVSLRKLKPPFDAETPFHEALRQATAELAEVKHHNLERLTELIADESGVYLIGDPIKGHPVSERIRKLAPFSVPNAVGTAISFTEAVAALHRANHAHGDIGEHNVRVLLDGTGLIENAGIWKAYSSSQTAGATVLPMMAPYLAPEVSKGALPTPSSDVYSIGVLLFQLLTGRFPYWGDQPLATAMLHTTEPIPSARQLNPAVPVVLDEVIKKAMSKDRATRYPSAAELLSDLRMIQDALRFGRSLTWPIQPTPQGELPSVARNRVEVPPKDAPTQRGKPKREKVSPLTPDDEEFRPQSDVPGWLKWIVVFLFATVAFMIGTFLFFNLKQPKLVVVPDLKGLTYAQAEDTLKPLKLKVRKMRAMISEEQPIDTILSTDPSPKTKIKEGSSVGVVVSMGGRFVVVPDVRGMRVDKARTLLESLGLDVIEPMKEELNKDVAKGQIVKQSPENGKRVERKTEVQLTISSGDQDPVVDPDNERRHTYKITIVLEDIENPVTLRVDMTDSKGTRTISEQDRQPNETVELSAEGQGPQAIFSIYYDDQLVAQHTKKAPVDNR